MKKEYLVIDYAVVLATMKIMSDYES